MDDLKEQLRAACPTSLAAGQIPRDQVIALLAPLVDAIEALRVEVAELRAAEVAE